MVGASAITPSSDTVVAPPPTHGNVVQYAMSQLDTPYVWAGSAPGGFDCSGLVMWAYAQVGVSLPHSSYAQYGYGVPVSRDQLQPGDLVFFDGLGHVGIYIGGGQFVHAPHTGDVVKISSLDESWYAATYRRRPPDPLARSDSRQAYKSATSSAKWSMITLRLSFSVGVTSSCSAENSRGTIVKRLICS